jgi:hypothetical protein
MGGDCYEFAVRKKKKEKALAKSPAKNRPKVTCSGAKNHKSDRQIGRIMRDSP